MISKAALSSACIADETVCFELHSLLSCSTMAYICITTPNRCRPRRSTGGPAVESWSCARALRRSRRQRRRPCSTSPTIGTSGIPTPSTTTTSTEEIDGIGYGDEVFNSMSTRTKTGRSTWATRQQMRGTMPGLRAVLYGLGFRWSSLCPAARSISANDLRVVAACTSICTDGSWA